MVSPAGNLTGRVGDFGLGLTKPVEDGDISIAGGLLDDEAVVFVAVEAGFGVDCFSGWEAFFSVALGGNLGVLGWAGLVGVFATVGDFAGGFVVDFVPTEAGAGLDAVLLALAAGTFLSAFFTAVPFWALPAPASAFFSGADIDWPSALSFVATLPAVAPLSVLVST